MLKYMSRFTTPQAKKLYVHVRANGAKMEYRDANCGNVPVYLRLKESCNWENIEVVNNETNTKLGLLTEFYPKDIIVWVQSDIGDVICE